MRCFLDHWLNAKKQNLIGNLSEKTYAIIIKRIMLICYLGSLKFNLPIMQPFRHTHFHPPRHHAVRGSTNPSRLPTEIPHPSSFMWFWEFLTRFPRLCDFFELIPWSFDYDSFTYVNLLLFTRWVTLACYGIALSCVVVTLVHKVVALGP